MPNKKLDARVGPIPVPEQTHLFTSSEWFETYEDNLYDMYQIIKSYNRDSGTAVFDNLTFNTFVSYCYRRSNMQKPMWYRKYGNAMD